MAVEIREMAQFDMNSLREGQDGIEIDVMLGAYRASFSVYRDDLELNFAKGDGRSLSSVDLFRKQITEYRGRLSAIRESHFWEGSLRCLWP